MNPLQRYRQKLAQENFSFDQRQEQIVLQLQQIYDEFLTLDKKRGRLLQRWLKPKTVQGLYLWGPVGAGKTWLMDIFFESLPADKKIRMHFHQFMQHIHHELKILQGHPNPLKLVAAHFAKQTHIICLDEFWVTDIADAMLLANLLEALFAEGISLVTTANCPPEELYRNGLQRARFMPAIHLLQQHLKVLQLDPQQDYRLRPQKPAGNYFYPLNKKAEQHMEQSFAHYACHADQLEKSIHVAGRDIALIRRDHDVIWFDFQQICHAPRSQMDYLELAKHFSTVLISNVPKITAQAENSASYFIKLVDVFYDAKVQLILSAEVPVLELYPKGKLAVDFQRTCSRLLEMQGKEYQEQRGR